MLFTVVNNLWNCCFSYARGLPWMTVYLFINLHMCCFPAWKLIIFSQQLDCTCQVLAITWNCLKSLNELWGARRCRILVLDTGFGFFFSLFCLCLISWRRSYLLTAIQWNKQIKHWYTVWATSYWSSCWYIQTTDGTGLTSLHREG